MPKLGIGDSIQVDNRYIYICCFYANISERYALYKIVLQSSLVTSKIV